MKVLYYWKIFSTISKVELIGKKKFATVAFNLKYKVFVVYVAALSIDSGDEVYTFKKSQIAYLKVDKVPTNVFSKYANFTKVFLPKLATELSKHTKINNHAIELIDDQQPPYGSIYSLGQVELEI